MIGTLVALTGGIGLFLLGMILLTDGLKAFAGEALGRALMRFTGTPLKAFGSGALVTTMVQSSSATTVTVIGFVSAGLLTLPQALGVIFGASLGTTGTGWIVSVLGLKVNLGFYALPLVGIGAFLKLLGHGRWKSLGLALAGFGLIFVGIDTLRDGMQRFSSVSTFVALPSGGIGGHLLAIAIGTVMTLIMQSSSAAVATMLTALHAGAVNFEQAASVVIGASIGTTVTAALATIGASVPAKRTALAYILFTLATALVALALLPAFLWSMNVVQEYSGFKASATSLAAFHTLFVALGATLFLPFVNDFARAIERVLPDRSSKLTRHIDNSLLQAPTVALEATRRALINTARELFIALHAILRGRPTDANNLRGAQIERAIADIQRFLAKIPCQIEGEPLSQSRVAQMHAIDHLLRLQSRLHPDSGVRRMLTRERLQPAVTRCQKLLELGEAGLDRRAAADWLVSMKGTALELADQRKQDRSAVLEQSVSSGSDPLQTLQMLDAMRWIERVSHHTWRLCYHLGADGHLDAGAIDDIVTETDQAITKQTAKYENRIAHSRFPRGSLGRPAAAASLTLPADP